MTLETAFINKERFRHDMTMKVIKLKSVKEMNSFSSERKEMLALDFFKIEKNRKIFLG